MTNRTKKSPEASEGDAVRLVRTLGRRTETQLADDVGVTEGMLYRWADKLGKESTAKSDEQGESLDRSIVEFVKTTNCSISSARSQDHTGLLAGDASSHYHLMLRPQPSAPMFQ